MRSPTFPTSAEIERTFPALRTLFTAFADGHYDLLIVVGRPGLCKSQLIKEAVGDRAFLLKGHNTPLACYIDLFHNRHKNIIIDDAEPLYQERQGKMLMRSLTETDAIKVISWNSTNKLLRDNGVPQRFHTASKVCIICNRWVSVNELTEALEDRAHIVYFDPPALEVHKEVGNWFWDQQIHDFIGQRLHLLDLSTARLYVKAWQRKKAGGDWQAFVTRHCYTTTIRVVQELEEDAECTTVKAREEKFAKLTKQSRATYHNIKKALKQNGQLQPITPETVPCIPLKGKEPPKVDLEALEAENQPDAVGEGDDEGGADCEQRAG